MAYETRSESIAPHWEVEVYELESTRPEALVEELAHQIRLAFHNHSYGISADSHHDYDGDAEAAGELIRIWFGEANQGTRPELEPIRWRDVITE